MAVLNVVYYPDAPLTEKADPIDLIDAETPKLVADMLETMLAHDGVGLAGPQVGLKKRIFVLREPGGQPQCFINPELSEFEGSAVGEEGCLSIPRIYAEVPRAASVRVRAKNERGEDLDFVAKDFLARVIQHEFDHLEGIIFPDRLDIITRQSLLTEWEAVREELLTTQKAPH